MERELGDSFDPSKEFLLRGGKKSPPSRARDLRDKTAYNIAEFGIGLNPACREYVTNLEDLGKLGHFHIGIGSSYAIGGKVKAPCHIDAIGKDGIMSLMTKLFTIKECKT